MTVFAVVIPYEGAVELFATKQGAENYLALSGQEDYFYIEEMEVK